MYASNQRGGTLHILLLLVFFFCYYRIFNVSAKEGTIYKTKPKI